MTRPVFARGTGTSPRGPEGPRGPVSTVPGPPGYNATGAAQDQQSIADYIAQTAGPNPVATALSVSNVVGRPAATAALTQATGTGHALQKYGVVLDVSGSGFDSHQVESLNPIYNHENGRIAGVYTAYENVAGVIHGTIGLAWSDDGFTWEKAGQFFTGSGVDGAPDKAGCTGPTLVYDATNQQWCFFYIGLTEPGYEAGVKRLCLATSPTLIDPTWTRRGAVLNPSGASTGASAWRKTAVWHPSFIQVGGTWFCFINATGADDKESIGYATAATLTGPWTFQDAACPLIAPAAAEAIAGDPAVFKVPGGYEMSYFIAAHGPETGSDWYTTTSDADFPLGWTAHDPTDLSRRIVAPTQGGYDEKYAHKPCLLQLAGRTFHYYTAVNNADHRCVALAIDPPLAQVPADRSLVNSTPLDSLTTKRNLALALAKAGILADESPILRDDFARSNRSLANDPAPTGQAWYIDTGSYGIYNEQAHASNPSGASFAIIDVGAQWTSFEAMFTGPLDIGAGHGLGLFWDYVGGSQHIYCEIKPTSGIIEVVRDGGAAVLTASAPGAIKRGDRLRVDRDVNDTSGLHTVTVNGRRVAQFTRTGYTRSTKVGLRSYQEQEAAFDAIRVWA